MDEEDTFVHGELTLYYFARRPSVIQSSPVEFVLVRARHADSQRAPQDPPLCALRPDLRVSLP